MKTIVFVCVGNACRSQMAEGFARALGREDLVIYSAGSHPLGCIPRETIEAMRACGIDITGQHSKGLPDLPDIEFDCVVTMGCGDNCPTLRARQRIDWQIPDPYGRGGDHFDRVRDLIRREVRELLEGI